MRMVQAVSRSGGFSGVSLIAAETPFSVAHVCVVIADRAQSFLRTPRTEARGNSDHYYFQIAPETISEGLKSKLFLGGACPRLP